MVTNLDDKPWSDVQHLAGVNIGEVDKRVAEGLAE